MEAIFIILVLLFSVIIHEVSHGYAALALGDPTAKYEGRLTLNPLKHLDLVGSFLVPLLGYLFGGIIIGWAKPVPFNPYNLRSQRWGEALVAVAGPASNIVLALLFGLLVRYMESGALGTSQSIYLAKYLVFINIILALFNLLPLPPLDGSKILFALLPRFAQQFRRVLEQYGMFIVILFIFSLWGFLVPVADYAFTLFTGGSF